MEYALDLSRRSRATYVGEHPSASLVLRCLGLGSLWSRHKKASYGPWTLYHTPEGGYSERQSRLISVLHHRVSCPHNTDDVLPALVLASLIHPAPPEGLLAAATLLIAERVVEVVL
jgi:hypothetical protein